jgi:GNAT superfamily N-acetyltransferase
MSGVAVHVREIQAADHEALRELFLAARLDTFVWEAPGSFALSDFDQVIDGELVLVALQGDQVVGFAGIWLAESFLHSLFVHPANQRQGVGKALLAACAPHFGQHASLKCARPNQRALQFYLSQGWVLRQEVNDPDGAFYLMVCWPHDGVQP